MLLESPRLDALGVEAAPEYRHGPASSGRWRESLLAPHELLGRPGIPTPAGETGSGGMRRRAMRRSSPT